MSENSLYFFEKWNEKGRALLRSALFDFYLSNSSIYL